MNTVEEGYLPFDGILQMLTSFSGHHQVHITHQSAAGYPVPQHPKVSYLPKTGMGIIKTVRDHWRQQEKTVDKGRSSSADNPIQKMSVDQMEMDVTKRKNCQRIVVLGAPKVGKTSILQRFLGKDFKEDYEPTTDDFHRKLFHIRGQTYQVDLLDAASERDFPAKRRLSILTGDIFLLVFSLDDRESFREVCELLAEIKAAKTKILKSKTAARVPVVMCGNKLDLCAHRAVSRTEVTESLREQHVTFTETSAKDGSGLESLFRAVSTVGGLPEETSPALHDVIPILTFRSLCVTQRTRRGSRGSCGPLAAVDPVARRPSFTSDLTLVLGSSAKNNKLERCQIQ